MSEATRLRRIQDLNHRLFDTSFVALLISFLILMERRYCEETVAVRGEMVQEARVSLAEQVTPLL